MCYISAVTYDSNISVSDFQRRQTPKWIFSTFLLFLCMLDKTGTNVCLLTLRETIFYCKLKNSHWKTFSTFWLTSTKIYKEQITSLRRFVYECIEEIFFLIKKLLETIKFLFCIKWHIWRKLKEIYTKLNICIYF